MSSSIFDTLGMSTTFVILATSGMTILGYIVLVVAAWICIRLAKKAINAAFDKLVDRFRAAGDSANVTLLGFGRHAAMIGMYFAAAAIVVSNIPVLNDGVNKLLAASGVIALVLGVASQQALGAVASGIMILFFKPFTVGNVVNVVSVGVVGTVEEISLNHTVLKTIENKRVIIPNSTMSTAVVENFDYEDKRVCLAMDIGITYESDAAYALQLLQEVVGKHESYLDTRTEQQKFDGMPLVKAFVFELADSAVVLRTMLWGADNATVIGMRSALMLQVKQEFDAKGVDLAYPHIVVVQKG